MNKRILLLLNLLGIVFIILLLHYPGKGNEMSVQEKKRMVYSSIEDDSDWERLPPPKPREWLAVFDEEGQTFEEYKRQVRNIKTDKRTTIYIQPLGNLNARFVRILKEMREYAQVYFCTKAILNGPLPIPQESFNSRRQQFDADKILQSLIQRRPSDALAYVGVMEWDLYVKDINFVFGLASLDERVGVYSMARYGDDYRMRLKRVLKVMTHEIGHILSMRHCIFYKCTMCGSNSLAESDRRPIHLCPVCLKKLEWNLKFDRNERYRRLRDFYRKVGFEKEAAFAARQSIKGN